MFCNVHKSVFSAFLLKLVCLDCKKNPSFFSVRLLPLVAEEGAAVGRSQSVDMCFFSVVCCAIHFPGIIN